MLARIAPTTKPPFAPSSGPALGEQNQVPEAGANFLPWTRGRKGGGRSCGNKLFRGSGGPGHMGMAQCRLPTQPGHPQGLQGGITGQADLAGHPHPSPTHRKASKTAPRLTAKGCTGAGP